MKKTLVSIILALVLVFSCAVAEENLAVDSPAIKDIPAVVISTDGTVIETMSIMDLEVKPESIQEKVFLKVSEEGFENVELPEEAVLEEFHELVIEGYKDEYGMVAAVFAYPTKYEVGTNLTALIGIIYSEEEVVWTALNAQVVEDGSVAVLFPQELLQEVSTHEAVMALVRG